VTDLAKLVESNRFMGREMLLWLWFESELHETELRASDGKTCSLWIETQITLADGEEETRIKSGMPAAAPEAKQALRQGKLPKQARMHAIVGEHEFTWVLKADDLAIGGLKVPAELKAKDDRYEALYERMRLTEELEAALESLFADFVALRLSPTWSQQVVPLLQAWAHGEKVDERAHAAIRATLGKKKVRPA
jgi:hypothetical protein